jgi:hypothetical protein
MTDPTPDPEALIQQSKEIMASFRELERVLLEANRAMTLFSATLYYASQSLEESQESDPGDWAAANAIARPG